MVNEVVSQQALLFLKSIQIGIMFAVIYDVVRIIRKLFKHVDWLVQVEDLLYWLGCIVLGFLLLYMHNFAEIRIYVFMGMILGAVLYLMTVSVVVMQIATYIIDTLKKILTKVIHILAIPLRWLLDKLMIPVRGMKLCVNTGVVYTKKRHKQMRKQRYFNQADRQTEKRIKREVKVRNSQE